MNEKPVNSHFFNGEIIVDCVLRKLLRVREHCEVWLVYDRKKQRPAVLKLLHKKHRRAEIFPDLAHFLLHSECPQLIRLLDFRELGDYFAAELEYADGGTLARRLDQSGSIPFAQTVFLLREILSALAELHRNGIVHRDIKPGNILLTSNGTVKLSDFSIACLKSHPETGPQVFGTPSVMSPEQTFDSTKVDERSDFFSLSSVIYEMLTGKPRFPRRDFVTTLKIIRDSRPDRFQEELREYATGDFIDLLERMAANRPEDRPETTTAILAELDYMRLPCAPL